MILFSYFGNKIPQLMLEPKSHIKLVKKTFQIINLKIICSFFPHNMSAFSKTVNYKPN